NGAHRQAFPLAIMLDSSVVDETHATKRVADPKAPRRRRPERVEVAGGQMLPTNVVDALEANPVESEQSRRTGYPEIAVFRLSKRLYTRGRAFFGSPGRVIELLDAQVGRQRAGGRAKHEGRHISAQRSQEPCFNPDFH